MSSIPMKLGTNKDHTKKVVHLSVQNNVQVHDVALFTCQYRDISFQNGVGIIFININQQVFKFYSEVQ